MSDATVHLVPSTDYLHAFVVDGEGRRRVCLGSVLLRAVQHDDAAQHAFRSLISDLARSIEIPGRD